MKTDSSFDLGSSGEAATASAPVRELLAVVAAHNALELLLEWDKSRDFIVPYRVRDPIHAAMKRIRAVLATPGTKDGS